MIVIETDYHRRRYMPMKLQLLADSLIEHLKDYGIRDSTIDTYRSGCKRLLRFATDHNTTEYSPELLDEYALNLDNQLECGSIGYDYHLFQARVVRLLKALGETGKPDFSAARNNAETYPVPLEDHVLIDGILSSSYLTSSVKTNLSAPIRHLLWYAHENGYQTCGIDDHIVMRFLITEAPCSNPRSMGRVLQGVKLTTVYMKRNGIGTLKHDYTQLKSRSESSRLIPPFSEGEIACIAGGTETDSVLGARDHAIILLAYGTGLRGIDIVQLKLSDIDWRNQEARILQSKTADPIIVELNGNVMNALADYVLTKRPACNVPEVFVTVTAPYRKLVPRFAKMIDKYCKAAGIPKLPGRAFHSIRRTFETTLASKGIPLETVSALAGHKDIESDKPYLTFDKDKTSFISMGFSDVPITAGIYAGLFNDITDREGVGAQ